MKIEFSGPSGYWRGPAPWYFVTVPPHECEALKAISGSVTYGWGMIPADVGIGKTTWKTSLFHKNGCYVVPLKDSVRKAENLDNGDVISVRLEIHIK